MKRLLFIIVLAIVGASCQKDSKSYYPDYYRTYNQVRKLQSEGKWQEAISTFQRAERLVEFVPPDHFIAARNIAIALNDCDLAKSYYQKAVNQGYDFEQFKYSGEKCAEISDQSYEAPEFDTEYRNAILQMIEADQAARTVKGGDARPLHVIDSLNIHQLLSLIDEKGYPNPKIVGHTAAGDAFILLLHFDSDIGNKILKPIIDKAYNDGFIAPSQYAWIIDRRRNWGPEKLDPHYYQLPTHKYFDLSKEEIAEIDNRRDSIGLKPLSEMNISRTENGGISIQMY